MAYLDIEGGVAAVNSAVDGARLGAGTEVLDGGVHGANAGVGLEEKIAVGGQLGDGDVGESGEQLLGLGDSLDVAEYKYIKNSFKKYDKSYKIKSNYRRKILGAKSPSFFRISQVDWMRETSLTETSSLP